ncbi:LPXTG cell wall anchor domain-containing protein [Aeromicrobium phragmitis]|uniref:LPXTG cell wall anchor domain-containing protein n=1 Tax=Aeromicrobium phragmitis TaxID=2478914 RepID=A0A3L8PNW5_9ACTN|nr:LPXTG cell wall anchor domain-containing protein [Aeromicrobium phragmitis]RLV57086.1 LPXTG cell wall anchor domain-containing protein [Aeromicrobium phragmitis]
MNKLRSKLAAVFVAVSALVLAPTAATAEYTPAGPAAGAVIIAPGGTATIPFTGFAPNEPVEFTLTGFNASDATLASLKAAPVESTSITKQADANGAVSVTVTLPDNAAGEYTLTATGQQSGETAVVAIVTGTAAGGGGTGGGETSTAGAIPATGSDSASTIALVAGGVLLAGGLVVAGAALRRQRQH